MIIEEDGVLPKCELCGMRTKNMDRHRKSKTCEQARRRRENEEKQDEQSGADRVTFTVNRATLQRVRQFKYLGRIFTDDDKDEECIKMNLNNARKIWGCIAKIFKEEEGANAKCMAKFYATIVQAVLHTMGQAMRLHNITSACTC